MDFLAFADGVICNDHYRGHPAEEAEPSFVRKLKLRAHETPLTNSSACARETPRTTASFKVEPSEVVFSDFEVGKTYEARVLVTNVGKLSKFRVLPISPGHRSLFTIKYDVPPNIAPGLQWPVTIFFHPTTENDVHCIVEIKAETGYTGFSIRGLTRKALIVVDTTEVNFGTVTVGQSMKKYVHVRNNGVLAGTVTIGGSFQQVAEKVHTNPQTNSEEQFFQVVPAAGSFTLSALSERIVELYFAPFQEDVLDCGVTFSCRDSEISVTVKGRSTKLPVFPVNPDIDFRWCFYGSMYCEEVHLTNNSAVTASVVTKVPRHLKDVIRFVPSTITVQANSSFFTKLFFTPSCDLDTDFECVVELDVKGQTLPSILRVIANLTTRAPRLLLKVLDFGFLFVNEEKLLCAEVENQSSLLQTISFLKVPEFITVDPPKAVLLPNETFSFRVLCSAPIVGSFNHSLIVTNEGGDRESLEVKGVGVKPTLLLAESTIHLPPCPLKDCVSASTVLSNNCDEIRHFQFLSPYELILVSPSSGSLKPGESVSIMVFLFSQAPITAKVEPIVVPKAGKKKASSKFSGSVATHPRETQEEEIGAYGPLFEDWEKNPKCEGARHKTITVICSSTGTTAEDLPLLIMCTVIFPVVVARELSSAEVSQHAVLKRKVKTGKKSPASSLVAVSPSIQVSAASSALRVDFGESALGHTQERVCILSNLSSISTFLQLCPPNTYSCFSVIRPPRPYLEPKEDDAILVRFKPCEFGNYTEVLRIRTSFNDVFMRLSGMCSSTELSISIGSLDNNAVDVGSMEELIFEPTKKGMTSLKNVFFNNSGTFPLDVSLKIEHSDDFPILTRNFFCHPREISIPPHGKVTTKIYFSPQEVGKHAGSLVLHAGSFKQVLPISGRCTDCSTYVFSPNHDGVDFQDGVRVSQLHPPCLGSSSDYPLQLQFARGETKTFIVGSVKTGPNVEFIVDNWEESFKACGWSLSSTRVSVLSGSESLITISLLSDKAIGGLLPYCSFAIAVKCPADPSNNCFVYVSCIGS